MDLWGNVKIPYLPLDSVSGSDWKDVPQNLSADGYSSLTGVPLSHISHTSSKAGFSFPLESNYIHLQCSKIVASDRSNTIDLLKADGLDSMRSDLSGLWKTYELPNGTWHGIRSNNYTETSWSLGLNRFVDPLWFGGNKTRLDYEKVEAANAISSHPGLHRLNHFTNEAGIKAAPTQLIFQAALKARWVGATTFFYTGYFDVTQRYVESRITCTQSETLQQSCAVTAQRPSRRPLAPDTITPLSFPLIFYGLSKELPQTTSGVITYQTEPSLYYLADPSLKAMTMVEKNFLENISEKDLGIRLGQLLNTYLQLSQRSPNSYNGGADGNALEPNITTTAETTESVVLFGVSDVWAALCLTSCVAMLAAGILSVVIAHWSRGPEILGYVSTVFRDSKHIELPEGSDQLTATGLSQSMANKRMRYGVLRNEKGEELCIGVGREEDTGRITENRAD